MSYKAPVTDMSFLLQHVFDVQNAYQDIERFSDFDYDLYNAVLEEGAKLAENVLHPLNRSGDEEGCVHSGTDVSTPQGFKQAYQQFCQGGWQSVNADPEYGGQGLPKSLHVLIEEMQYAANTSFTLYPSLTSGAVAAIAAHASEELKSVYLENMVSGVWSGSMCLTEPHSGSDLGILKTKAEPNDEGSYKITGTKIFITGGEHDLAENIIHLVLARLPGAPAGPRGISLFLVPKFMVDEKGQCAGRNAVSCGSIEHKMGIKGSSTCVMNFDQACGFLIGPENRGLNCMFTMMNKERLSISLQGIGLADASYQIARQYAEERIQGRSTREGQKGAAILEHADVRRMLMSMRSLTEVNRAFAVYMGMQIDLEEFATDSAAKSAAQQKVALLTPIAKSFFTDTGYENCGQGIQVLGGHGYVREWGVEQFVRDAKIAQIYEGTNGIQAQDLLVRKVCADKGVALENLLGEIEQTLQAAKQYPNYTHELSKSVEQIRQLTALLIEQTQQQGEATQGAAVEYLHSVALVLGGWFWLKILNASEHLDELSQNRKIAAADFYFKHQLVKLETYKRSIESGYLEMHQLDDELI